LRNESNGLDAVAPKMQIEKNLRKSNINLQSNDACFNLSKKVLLVSTIMMPLSPD
jgi:hypothetical protein